MIGVEGTFINELKKDCSVNIHLREISSEEKKKKRMISREEKKKKKLRQKRSIRSHYPPS